MKSLNVEGYWNLTMEDRRKVDDWLVEIGQSKNHVHTIVERYDGRIEIQKYARNVDGTYRLNRAGDKIQSDVVVYDKDRASWPLA